MVIGCRGASGQHQFGKRQLCRQRNALLRQSRPNRVQRHQPVEQFLVERRRKGARQRLVEMMMAIDQPGNNDKISRIEFLVNFIGWLTSRSHELGDLITIDHDSVGCRSIGASPDGKRVLNPGSQVCVFAIESGLGVQSVRDDPVTSVCQHSASFDAAVWSVFDAVAIHQTIHEVEQATDHHRVMKTVFIPAGIKNRIDIGLHHSGGSFRQLPDVAQHWLQLFVYCTCIEVAQHGIQEMLIDAESLSCHFVRVVAKVQSLVPDV